VIYKLKGEVYIVPRSDDDCIKSWNSCIRKLNIKADIVFFGNSITEGGEFQDLFPDKKVVVMGYIGEDTKGMLRRVDAITSVNPEKIFLMAGINGLKNQKLEDFSKWYELLVDSIQYTNPKADIYIQSILPITKESNFCDNNKIKVANNLLRELAKSKDISFIDLHSKFEKNNSLNEDFTYDGVHLKKEAYFIWKQEIKEYIYN
jgi:lysophospholipase L1-like esterase